MQQLIATPLRGWNLGEVELWAGVRVAKASSLPDSDIKSFASLSQDDFERVQKREYWLTLPTNEPQDEAQREAIQERILQCVEGLQIVSPNGWDGIIVKWSGAEISPNSRANGLTQFPPCEPTKWGGFIGFGSHRLEQIQTVIGGVERVFNKKIVRFQTPTRFSNGFSVNTLAKRGSIGFWHSTTRLHRWPNFPSDAHSTREYALPFPASIERSTLRYSKNFQGERQRFGVVLIKDRKKMQPGLHRNSRLAPPPLKRLFFFSSR